MATVWTLISNIPAWRYDPTISQKNGCRVYRLDYAGQTAQAGRDNHPKHGPGWKVQITGHPAYHYSDQDYTLAEITADVGADIEKLAAPVVVIEKPKPADVLQDLADNLTDNDHRMTDYEERQPW